MCWQILLTDQPSQYLRTMASAWASESRASSLATSISVSARLSRALGVGWSADRRSARWAED